MHGGAGPSSGAPTPRATTSCAAERPTPRATASRRRRRGTWAATRTTPFSACPSASPDLVDLHRAVTQREHQRLQPRVDAELREDVRDVVALGAERDVEALGDRLAVEAVGERLEHFALAPGQLLDRLPVGALLLAPVALVAQELHHLIERQ